MSNTQFDQPIVSIDVVPVAYRDAGEGEGLQLQVLRGYRLFEPFIGQIALPGVMLGHETLEEAAYRALKSKVGVEQAAVRRLLKLGAFDTTNRDPRGPTIAIVYIALIDPEFEPDEQKAAWDTWEPVDNKAWRPSPFDHDEIIYEAMKELGYRLWNDLPLTYTLLGSQFSTREALKLNKTLRAGEKTDETNFTRMIKKLPQVKPVGKTSGGKGRPSTIWSVG